ARRTKLVREDVRGPAVLPLRGLLRDGGQTGNRSRAIDVRHAGERLAVVHGNREGAVSVIFHVLRRDGTEDGIRWGRPPKDVGHERQADARPDFAGQGQADESAGPLAEGSDRSGRYEFARDREVRFRLPAIAVI